MSSAAAVRALFFFFFEKSRAVRSPFVAQREFVRFYGAAGVPVAMGYIRFVHPESIACYPDGGAWSE